MGFRTQFRGKACKPCRWAGCGGERKPRGLPTLGEGEAQTSAPGRDSLAGLKPSLQRPRRSIADTPAPSPSRLPGSPAPSRQPSPREGTRAGWILLCRLTSDSGPPPHVSLLLCPQKSETLRLDLVRGLERGTQAAAPGGCTVMGLPEPTASPSTPHKRHGEPRWLRERWELRSYCWSRP